MVEFFTIPMASNVTLQNDSFSPSLLHCFSNYCFEVLKYGESGEARGRCCPNAQEALARNDDKLSSAIETFTNFISDKNNGKEN